MILCNRKKDYQLQVTPHTCFKVAQDKIYDEPGIFKNDTTMKQHDNPPPLKWDLNKESQLSTTISI
jgi:hypothetical protein